MKTLTSEELQSKVFSFLRFPLIVCVVFIHISLTDVHGNLLCDLNENNFISKYASIAFSQSIARVAVPLFFLLSGYLFFYKCKFSAQLYLKKLKSRSGSLVVPYLVWNILLYIVAVLIGRQVISSFSYFFKIFWSLGEGCNPIAYQFWFIRDLIVLVVLSPIVYMGVRTINFLFPVILGILWFFDVFVFPVGFSVTAWFFFSLGACLSIRNINVIESLRSVKSWIYVLYVIFIILDVFTKAENYNYYIHHGSILTGIICAVKLSASLIDSGKVRVSCFLSSASFFIFAVHEPWIKKISTCIVDRVFPGTSDIYMVTRYFMNGFIIVALSLLMYYALNRFIPKITGFITGGR